MKIWHITVIVLSLLVLGGMAWQLWPSSDNNALEGPGSHQKIPENVSFNFHVKPILSDKCFACHGPDESKIQAGFRLDLESSALAPLPENPGNFAIIPQDADKSLLIERIHSTDPALVMPPPETNLKLSADDKKILRKWIEQGAQYTRHWAFIPPENPPVPTVKDSKWITNEIDAYILSKLEDNGLSPSPKASKPQLARRLSLDLTGLPPRQEDVRAFLADDAPGAYEKLIDKLLARETYGERMAQEWMDVARYADSHGYQDDSYRTMWPWRDWVIHAFNTNMPYDQFLTWQLAGDMLPQWSKETLLATGFNRNHPITQEGGVIDEEYRSAYVTDRTNTLGKGIMGITLECAKCHDHKYDPISQEDYFSLYAFFNNVGEKGLQMDAVQAANRKYYADAPHISISDEDINQLLHFINKPAGEDIKVMVMNDSVPRQTYVLERGNYDAPTEEVHPATPLAILSFPDTLPQNRYGLSQWITSDQNPLTARVFVNRLWAMLFGQGLVKTVEDFGNQGALPSHPELLDWLAYTFMKNDWDIQHMLKLMASSSTYQQQSRVTPRLLEIDPENVLLARGPRFRMSAEMIRDYVLATSGLLNQEIGGPSVKPYQPAGLWEETNAGSNRGILTSYQQDSGDDLYRRSLYTFWKRTLPPPSMTLFDAPNRDNCEVRRQKTNTPLQALALQNDIQILEASRVLAENTINKSNDTDHAVEALFEQILIRKPEPNEIETLENYYQQNMDKFRTDDESAERLLNHGNYKKTPHTEVARTAALMLVAQVIYNLDETITKE